MQTTPSTPPALAYHAIGSLCSLGENSRGTRLLEHVAATNTKRAEPIPAATVKMAIALMIADPSLSSPTALLEAEMIARIEGLGPALLAISDSLLVINQPETLTSIARDSLMRNAITHLARALAAEAGELCKALEKIEREGGAAT